MCIARSVAVARSRVKRKEHQRDRGSERGAKWGSQNMTQYTGKKKKKTKEKQKEITDDERERGYDSACLVGLGVCDDNNNKTDERSAAG